MRTVIRVGIAAMLTLAAGCGLPGASDTPQTQGPPPASAPVSAPASAAPSAPASAPASGSSSDPSPVIPPASASDSAGVPTPADPSQSATGDQLGQVVATRTSGNEGDRIVMKLYPVRRAGGTSHVNLSLESSKVMTVGQLLGDGNHQAIDDTGFAADGLQLVDGKNSKVHLVASDGNGQCVCSRNLLQARPSAGNPVLISATFAAPPADVKAVDVRVPSFGTVANVPVQ